jgi:hypothetical protein
MDKSELRIVFKYTAILIALIIVRWIVVVAIDFL